MPLWIGNHHTLGRHLSNLKSCVKVIDIKKTSNSFKQYSSGLANLLYNFQKFADDIKISRKIHLFVLYLISVSIKNGTSQCRYNPERYSYILSNGDSRFKTYKRIPQWSRIEANSDSLTLIKMALSAPRCRMA